MAANAVERQRSRRIAQEDGPDPVDIHVGKRLHLRRTLMGMTQEQLATAVGVTFQQVQKYERGSNRISASRLYDIARVLGVRIGFFFDDIDTEVTSARRNPLEMPLDQTDGERAQIMSRSETLEVVRSYWKLSTDLRRQVRALLEAMGEK